MGWGVPIETPSHGEACLRDAQTTRWGAEKEDRDSQLFWCGKQSAHRGPLIQADVDPKPQAGGPIKGQEG